MSPFLPHFFPCVCLWVLRMSIVCDTGQKCLRVHWGALNGWLKCSSGARVEPHKVS